MDSDYQLRHEGRDAKQTTGGARARMVSRAFSWDVIAGQVKKILISEIHK